MNDSEISKESGKQDDVVVNVFGKTDVGRVRDHNEDNFLIADLTAKNRSILPEVRTHTVGPQGSLFVVCDGMGGAAAGEVASKIGADTIYEIMQESDPPDDDIALAHCLNNAICEAGTRIYTAAKLNRGQRGMGTTATAAALRKSRLVIGQVGDSRAYIFRDGVLVQVTKDQSLVQQLIDAKQLTEEEAKTFDKSNIILQALGTTAEVHVDMTSVELKFGDVLIMCSDGLSGFVESKQILDAVTQYPEPMDACRVLIEMACDGGGEDNITVIVANFDGKNLLVDSSDGDKLEYKKYNFNNATETTAVGPAPKPQNSSNKRDKATPKSTTDVSDAINTTQTSPRKNKIGLLIGIVAAILIIVGLVGFLLMDSSDNTPPLALPIAPPSTAVPTTIEAPKVSKPHSPPANEPQLIPIDEQAIVGDGNNEHNVIESPKSKKSNPAISDNKENKDTIDDPSTKNNKISKPKLKTLPKINKRIDDVASKPSASKSKKKETPDSIIDENPY